MANDNTASPDTPASSSPAEKPERKSHTAGHKKSRKSSRKSLSPESKAALIPLDEADHELIRLRLERPTITYEEMGTAIGLSVSGVKKRLYNPLFVKAIQELQRSALEVIMGARGEAARRLVQLIKSGHEPTALKASLALLYDLLPAQKVAMNHSGAIDTTPQMTDAQIEKRIEEILHDAGINSGADKAISELISRAGADPARGEGEKSQ
jgi:hypothetical protein